MKKLIFVAALLIFFVAAALPSYGQAIYCNYACYYPFYYNYGYYYNNPFYYNYPFYSYGYGYGYSPYYYYGYYSYPLYYSVFPAVQLGFIVPTNADYDWYNALRDKARKAELRKKSEYKEKEYAQTYPSQSYSKDLEDGMRQFKQMNYQSAQDIFRRAIVADEDTARARFLFGLSLAVEGDYVNAEKALRSGFERATDLAVVQGFNIEELFKDKAEFEKQWSALEKKTDTREAAFVAGFIHFGKNDLTKARAAWNKVLQANPANVLVQRLVEYIDKRK